MIYLWNNHGSSMDFKDKDTALRRCRYRGESATEGVFMWSIDGILYFSDTLKP